MDISHSQSRENLVAMHDASMGVAANGAAGSSAQAQAKTTEIVAMNDGQSGAKSTYDIHQADTK